MPEFVILKHDSPEGHHFDLMLQAGEVLKTWALPQAPVLDVEMACRALPDHRVAYLEYEGPVSKNRGTVVQWDRGHYETVSRAAGQWTATIAGRKLTGQIILTQVDVNTDRWEFAWRSV